MKGINLDKPITYSVASLRFFNKGESHVNRFCKDNVLVMVFEGVLRFSEDGEKYQVSKGEYFIQRANGYQEGYAPSDSPKYLYVHFEGCWDNCEFTLEKRGSFDCEKLMDMMREMDNLAHGKHSYTKRCETFYRILCALKTKREKHTIANEMAQFIEKADLNTVKLDAICKKFNFSKNHVINIFKKEYGVTPINYINTLKLKRAKYLLEVTSDTVDSIAEKSGFSDYSHFYKLFCRENGMPPTKWRKRVQV